MMRLVSHFHPSILNDIPCLNVMYCIGMLTYHKPQSQETAHGFDIGAA